MTQGPPQRRRLNGPRRAGVLWRTRLCPPPPPVPAGQSRLRYWDTVEGQFKERRFFSPGSVVPARGGQRPFQAFLNCPAIVKQGGEHAREAQKVATAALAEWPLPPTPLLDKLFDPPTGTATWRDRCLWPDSVYVASGDGGV